MPSSIIALAAASMAFVGTHFALSHPLRRPLVSLVGENLFRLIYSLVALATFVWMVQAFRAVGPGGPALWDGKGDALWIAASVIMLLASVLLAGSFVRNPALPDPRAAKHAAAGVHGVFHVTRHPMMWSFALWATVHVMLSPTPRQLVLAGAIALLALLGAHMQDRKKEALMGEAWAGWEAQTSYWPRLGGLKHAGAAAWLGGAAIWLAATYGHIHANGWDAGIWRWV
ncbi:NnrU family protein [Qipengyuania sp. GH1]|uniref:NnrU family protein n=1 Tax=Qipengyuania aestuarii TaxID=2867241 RepID=UPI001C88A70C|nr:NnrU family protein [Qipengyuania aestuarii]MBX7536697.1 NnrU family protein [Qipengyuania aestuarii]